MGRVDWARESMFPPDIAASLAGWDAKDTHVAGGRAWSGDSIHVLLTGATGFLGANVLAHLLVRAHKQDVKVRHPGHMAVCVCVCA